MSLYLPILGINTAAQHCAVAVLGHTVAFENSETLAQGQSQRLMPLIQETLAEAGLKFGNLKAIAVTTGPGSFTGLRIGLAAAHGMALALGIPIIGIDSFAAFTASLIADDLMPRAVIVESRRAELYWCLIDPAGEQVTDPSNDLPADIAAYLKNRPALLCGDGAGAVHVLLPDHGYIDQSAGPSPLAIARLGLAALERELPQALPQAFYIRPPDAQPTLQ